MTDLDIKCADCGEDLVFTEQFDDRTYYEVFWVESDHHPDKKFCDVTCIVNHEEDNE